MVIIVISCSLQWIQLIPLIRDLFEAIHLHTSDARFGSPNEWIEYLATARGALIWSEKKENDLFFAH